MYEFPSAYIHNAQKTKDNTNEAGPIPAIEDKVYDEVPNPTGEKSSGDPPVTEETKSSDAPVTEETKSIDESAAESHDFDELGPPPLKPYDEMAKKIGKATAQKLSEARMARAKIVTMKHSPTIYFHGVPMK